VQFLIWPAFYGMQNSALAALAVTCVCVCVCFRVFMCVCIYFCLIVCVSVCAYLYTHVSEYVIATSIALFSFICDCRF
jgi:hypothetical protein